MKNLIKKLKEETYSCFEPYDVGFNQGIKKAIKIITDTDAEMKEFKESHTNYRTAVGDKNLIIEIPIKTLVAAFNGYPELPEGSKVKTGKNQEFAELIAEHLHDEIDQETGASHITTMIDGVFEHISEGFIDSEEVVNFTWG